MLYRCQRQIPHSFCFWARGELDEKATRQKLHLTQIRSLPLLENLIFSDFKTFCSRYTQGSSQCATAAACTSAYGPGRIPSGLCCFHWWALVALPRRCEKCDSWMLLCFWNLAVFWSRKYAFDSGPDELLECHSWILGASGTPSFDKPRVCTGLWPLLGACW